MTNKEIVRYAFGLVALIFVGYVVLTALGKDTIQLFAWFTVLLSSIFGTASAWYKASSVETKVDRVNTVMNGVEQKVNGQMTTLIDAATGGNKSGANSPPDGR